MDRYEVPIDERLAPLVEAAERGEEVVIMKDGREVARIAKAEPAARPPGDLDIEALARMQERIGALEVLPFDATAAVREMRDEGY